MDWRWAYFLFETDRARKAERYMQGHMQDILQNSTHQSGLAKHLKDRLVNIFREF